MPYLRFSRDKRGYENTYVFDDTRSTDGKSRPRMLYWFRTPPNVKVGRFSLDEDAIRAIEENNPDVGFDWKKMLKIQPAPRQKPKGAPHSRSQPDRGRRTRSSARASVSQASTPAAPTETELSQAPPPVDTLDTASADADELAAQAHLEALDEAEPVDEGLPEHPVVQLMGDETLARLRAHYAEIRARIAQAQLSPEQMDALETKVERLNPDAWVGLERAVAGIEGFERHAESIKAELNQPPPGRDDTAD